MIKITKLGFLFTLIYSLVLPSCTVHKKLNEKGYGVLWKKSIALKSHDASEPSISSDMYTSTKPLASVDESIYLKNELHEMESSRLDGFSSSTEPFKIGAQDFIVKGSDSTFSAKNQGVFTKKEAITNDHHQKSIYDQVQRVEKMAKTALLLGLISSPLNLLVGVGILPAIVSIVLAVISLRKIKKNPSIYAEKSKQNARFALLTSLASIGIVGSALLLLRSVGYESPLAALASVILSGFSIFAAIRSLIKQQKKSDYPIFRIIASIITIGLSSLFFISSFLLMLHLVIRF